MGKKPIVSVIYENERISIKNSLPYIKCVLRLSCMVHAPIYGRFMACTVNGSGTVPSLDSLRTTDVSPRSSPLRDVSRSSAAMSEQILLPFAGCSLESKPVPITPIKWP